MNQDNETKRKQLCDLKTKIASFDHCDINDLDDDDDVKIKCIPFSKIEKSNKTQTRCISIADFERKQRLRKMNIPGSMNKPNELRFMTENIKNNTVLEHVMNLPKTQHSLQKSLDGEYQKQIVRDYDKRRKETIGLWDKNAKKERIIRFMKPEPAGHFD